MFSPILLYTYYGIQLLGLAGLSLVLVTTMFSKLHRLPTLSAMLFAWIVSALVYTILLYVGELREPGWELCLYQAALINGASLLTSFSTTAFILESWFAMKDSLREEYTGKRRTRTILLLGFPWFGFITAGSTTFILGYTQATMVYRITAGFFCALDLRALNYTLGTINGLILAVSGVMAVRASLFVLRISKQVTRELDGKATHVPSARMGTAIRQGIFGAYIALDLVLNIVWAFLPHSPVPYMFFATNPLAMFLIFGTQIDYLRIWTSPFIRSKPRPISGTELGILVPPSPYSTASRDSGYPIAMTETRIQPYPEKSYV